MGIEGEKPQWETGLALKLWSCTALLSPNTHTNTHTATVVYAEQAASQPDFQNSKSIGKILEPAEMSANGARSVLPVGLECQLIRPALLPSPQQSRLVYLLRTGYLSSSASFKGEGQTESSTQ